MMLASESAPHDNDLQSESSYESESDDGEDSPPVVSAVPVQLCTHVAEDGEGYNLRSQCKKCAARIGLAMTVMESPEALAELKGLGVNRLVLGLPTLDESGSLHELDQQAQCVEWANGL